MIGLSAGCRRSAVYGAGRRKRACQQFNSLKQVFQLTNFISCSRFFHDSSSKFLKHLVFPARCTKTYPPQGKPCGGRCFLFSFRACHHRGFLSSLRSGEAATDARASGFAACRSGLSMRVIVAYPTTRAPSCIGIRFPTHRQCGYASGERNVIVPRADAPGGTEPTS